MGFWRREPLHERLAREGGLTERPPHDPGPHWGEVGIHGVHRQREWDAVATVMAPELAGAEARFVALPDGTLLAETDDLDVEPLADALEASVQPPYRAEAVRRPDGLWAVAARRIEVVDVQEEVDGDELVLTRRGGERTLEVEGAQAFGGLPTLERLIAGDGVISARRLDGSLWELELTLL
ncbi:MAG: hypothetical protein QOJ43_2474 [Gaiellaceae bacterium]|jgi:hypothetical protein|nr:hypothetical protein [Gaiellaceae bacterium]